jgi:hypothetical protein
MTARGLLCKASCHKPSRQLLSAGLGAYENTALTLRAPRSPPAPERLLRRQKGLIVEFPGGKPSGYRRDRPFYVARKFVYVTRKFDVGAGRQVITGKPPHSRSVVHKLIRNP